MKKRGPLKDAVVMFIILGTITAYVGAAGIPSASELIDKYTQALDSTSSFIEDYEKTAEGSFRGGRNSHAGKHFSRGQLRYDEQRLYEYEYSWGDWASLTFTEDKPHYTMSVVNSEMNYQNTKRVGDRHRPGKVMRRPRPQGQNITLHAHFGVSYLAGYIGSDERLDAILRKADRIEVQKKPQKVGDSDCFVIEADTKCGRYKVWLDPEHGFHPAKLLHEAGEGDYSDRHLMAKGDSAKEYLKNVRFEKVGDVWVPMEADSGSDLRGAQGDFAKDNYHYKRTKIVLNPDHDKLGSFDDPLENPSNDPELTNGTRVLMNHLPIDYTWQDGELVPDIDEAVIDEIDKMTEEIMARNTTVESTSPTVSELLKKYAETQDKLRSFIAKGESTIEYIKIPNQSGRMQKELCEFRTDGDRVNHRGSVWDKRLSKDKALYKSFLWDGKSFIQYRQGSQLTDSTVFIEKNDDSKKRMIATEYKGAPLMGICGGDYDRIDSILRKADDISLRQKTEQVGNSQCYVIDAVTKRGKYRVWIDHEHGYNIAKIELQKRKGELIHSGERVKIGMLFLLENVRFEKIDGVWVPVEADMKQYQDDQIRIIKWHHKRTKMTLNPDHNALGSFVPDNIPEYQI